MDTGTLLFTILILCGAGLYLAVEGGRRLRELHASRSWPSVPGEVLASEVKKRVSLPTKVDPSSHAFRALVRYRYEVDGRRYESEVIELGGRFRQTPFSAAGQVEEYPPGSTVTVYYDPARPERACLRRSGGGAMANVTAGAALLVLAAALGAGWPE